VAVTGNRISDDADVVRRWAIAGEGIVYKSRLDLIDDLKAGRLVELFPPEYCELAPLHLICAHRAQLTPVMNALHAFLRERCATLLGSHPSGGAQALSAI
jgi:DNA-binding transcriptional LysR family regulator